MKLNHKLCTVLLAVIAALCLCLGLAACDDKTPESQSPAGGSQTEQESGSGGGTSGGTESGTSGGTESESGTVSAASLAGKTFVVSDLQGDVNEELRRQTIEANKGIEWIFGTDGKMEAKNTVSMGGSTVVTIETCTYSVEGNTLKLTTISYYDSATGLVQTTPDTSLIRIFPFDGTNITITREAQGITMSLILREKVQ